MTLTWFMRYWGPVLLWMGCIFCFSGDAFSGRHTGEIIEPVIKRIVPNISDPALNLVHVLIRKLAHVTEYAILSYLVLRALRQDAPTPWTRRWAAIALAIGTAYAFSDEWHQSFMAERNASLYDAGLDTLGGFLMQAFLATYHRVRGLALNAK